MWFQVKLIIEARTVLAIPLQMDIVNPEESIYLRLNSIYVEDEDGLSQYAVHEAGVGVSVKRRIISYAT